MRWPATAAVLLLAAAVRADVQPSITTLSASVLSDTVCSETTASDSPCAVAEAGSSSSLMSGLVSVWALENVNDSVGSNTLTNTNGVTFSAGKHNNAGYFDRISGQSLSIASFVLPDSYTLAVWFYSDGATAEYAPVVVAHNSWNSQVPIAIYKNTGENKLIFSVGDGTTAVSCTSDAYTDDAWHVAIITYDETDKKVRGRVDSGTVCTSSALAGTRYSAAAPFRLGEWSVINQNFWKGRLDETYLWSRVLTEDEQLSIIAENFYPFP